MLKMRKLMGALILAGLVQVVLDAQDVLAPMGGQYLALRSLESFYSIGQY